MRQSKSWVVRGIALGLIGVTALLLIFPQPALTAALRGVSIWWDVLFPALLPFVIISELMLGFGIVHFIGTLLDPFMRPLFRVPGIGGFAMALGFASGYAVGARLTQQLWEQRLVNRVEGERLVSFITTSDPIFLIGAVSVGFFHDASLAAILGIAHYGTAVLLGLGMRFYGNGGDGDTPELTALKVNEPRRSIWLRAFSEMHKARVSDGRPIGLLLTQAVGSALQMNFILGGLVVFFSVILEVLTTGGIMGILHSGISSVLQLFGLSPSLSQAVVSGLFEVTLGAKESAGAGADLPLVSKAAIAAFVLSWSGLSVHAQVVSLLSSTTLRYAPFLTARFIHGILSAVAVIVLWHPLQPLRGSLAGLTWRTSGAFASDHGAAIASWSLALPGGALMFSVTLAGLAAAAIIWTALRLVMRIKVK